MDPMPKKFFHRWGPWTIDKEQCIATRTCTTNGCNECKEQKERHDFSDWEFIQSDSCMQYRRCKNIKCLKTETREFEHNFGSWEYHTEHCCEEKRVCKHCGYTEYRITHIPQKEISNSKECLIEIRCSRCGQILGTHSNHSWATKVISYFDCISYEIEEIKTRIEQLSSMSLLYPKNSMDYIKNQLEIIQLRDSLKKKETQKRLAEANDLGTFCVKCKKPLYLGKTNQRSKSISGFLSYSWQDTEYANKIDEILKQNGIYITRDIRDLNLGTNLYEFMNRVENSKYVIVIISDSYLKSKNCMYEATKIVLSLVRNKGSILLPIVIGLDICNIQIRQNYMQYWLEKKEQIGIVSQNDARIYQEIIDCMFEFLNMCTERKYEKIEKSEDVKIPLTSQIVSRIREIEELK